MRNSQNIFSVRLSDEELSKLRQLAKQTAMKEATLVRRLIMVAQAEQVNVVAWSVTCKPVESSICLPN